MIVRIGPNGQFFYYSDATEGLSRSPLDLSRNLLEKSRLRDVTKQLKAAKEIFVE